MSEPTYNYVKGQGWVASANEHEYPSLRRINRKGNRVLTLIDRRPKWGECALYADPEWLDANGKAILEKFWEFAKNYEYDIPMSGEPLKRYCITVLSEPV